MPFETSKIVALTGSTRFKNQFLEIAARETLAGNIVLMPHVFRHEPEWKHLTEEQCANLDKLFGHFIDMCDELVVINSNGYLGEGTRRDVEKATQLGKPIRYAFSEQRVHITFVEHTSINPNISSEAVSRYHDLQLFLAASGITAECSLEIGTKDAFIDGDGEARRVPDGTLEITTDVYFTVSEIQNIPPMGASGFVISLCPPTLQNKIRGCVEALRITCLPDLPPTWEEMMTSYLLDKTRVRATPESIMDLRETVLMFPPQFGGRVSADIGITNV